MMTKIERLQLENDVLRDIIAHAYDRVSDRSIDAFERLGMISAIVSKESVDRDLAFAMEHRCVMDYIKSCRDNK